MDKSVKDKRTYQGRAITESSDSDFNFFSTVSQTAFNKLPNLVYKSSTQIDSRKPTYYQDHMKELYSRSIFDRVNNSKAKDSTNNEPRVEGRNVLSFPGDDKDVKGSCEFSKPGDQELERENEDIGESKMKSESKMLGTAQILCGVVSVDLKGDGLIMDIKHKGSKWEVSDLSLSESESLQQVFEDENVIANTSSESVHNREIVANANEGFVGNVTLEYSDSTESAEGRKHLMDTEKQVELTTSDNEFLVFDDSNDEELYDEEPERGKTQTELWDIYDIDEDEILSLSRRSSFDHLISSEDYKKLNIERRVLIGPYKFKIVGNESRYGSVYRAISKAVYNRESEYKQVHKNIIKQMEVNWDYYHQKFQTKGSVPSLAESEKTSKCPYHLQKSHCAQSRQTPWIFHELHAAATYYGFHSTLFDTMKEDTRAFPIFFNDVVNIVPVSDVHYYFLRSGDNISDWQYELLIPIGFVGPIPQREIQIKFRNTILAHLASLSPTRYPLEDECRDYEEAKYWRKGLSILNILTSTFPLRISRKIIPECSNSAERQEDKSCPLNKMDGETDDTKSINPEEPALLESINNDIKEESNSGIKKESNNDVNEESNNNDTNEESNNNDINEESNHNDINEENNNKDITEGNNSKEVDSKEDSMEVAAQSPNVKNHSDKFRVPSNRVNIQQISYHNRIKLDLGLHYRNFMVHRTRTHDLFSLLSEIMFSRLSKTKELRDQVKNDIRKFAYMHVVSKHRRKETLVKRKPNLKHKNYENLFSKKPDYGSINDLETAAHFFKFSYVVIGCDSNYNFYWKESKDADEKKPYFAFFLYTFCKMGKPVHKWYFLAEEQSALEAYQLHFGGSTIRRLRKWNNDLYYRPMLSQYTQNFGRKSNWSIVKKILGIENKRPSIMHYVIPVKTPTQGFWLKSDKETGAMIDKVITEHGAKNSQIHRLSSNGAYHLLKVEKHKVSTWAKLWSLKNEPKYSNNRPEIGAWLQSTSLGLWHSLNPSPLIATARQSLLTALKRRVNKFLAEAKESYDDEMNAAGLRTQTENEAEESSFASDNIV